MKRILGAGIILKANLIPAAILWAVGIIPAACVVPAACIVPATVAPARAAAAAETIAAPYWTENSGLIANLEPLDKTSSHAGKVLVGEVFDSPDFQRMLLLIPGWSQAYVLELATNEVVAYPAAALQDKLHQPIAPPESGGAVAGYFSVQPDASVVFRTADSQVVIAPAPPLVGEISREKLAERFPVYERRAAAYSPAPEAVQVVANTGAETEVLAFFGTWCSTCQEELPAVLATLDAAANPKIELRLIAVDEDLVEPVDLLTEYSVQDIPTLIVTRGGREIGRIIEEPKTTIEGDLARIIGAEPGR